MRQYSADLIDVVWLPAVVPLTGGLAAGTFIQPTRNFRNFRNKDDGMGNSFRMFRRGSSGSLTLMIMATSTQHQILMSLANLDVVSKAIVGPLVITDRNTKEIAFFTRASLAGQPNVPKGTQVSIIPWVFDYEKSAIQSVVVPTNVVGN